MNKLDVLRHGLVVSCQPVDDGPMDHPHIISAMAQAAIAGGANGVRIEGADNVKVVRAAIYQPIIGIVKRDLSESPVRITPFLEDVAALASAGADFIAYDATFRNRPVPCAEIVAAIIKSNCLAMADCSSVADAKIALKDNVSIIGTTLSGYTEDTEHMGPEPDFQLVRQFKELGGFVMAEGRFSTPELALGAIHAGADCVTVGTPLTRLEVNTTAFKNALSGDHDA